MIGKRLSCIGQLRIGQTCAMCHCMLGWCIGGVAGGFWGIEHRYRLVKRCDGTHYMIAWAVC